MRPAKLFFATRGHVLELENILDKNNNNNNDRLTAFDPGQPG